MPLASTVGRGKMPISATVNPARFELLAIGRGRGEVPRAELMRVEPAARRGPPPARRGSPRYCCGRPSRRQSGRPASAPGAPRRAPPRAGCIQCNAAFENTASNSRSKARSCPGMTRASRPFARAAATMSGAASTATTSAPAAAIFSVSAPSPQPRSRMRSPGCGGEQFEDRRRRAPGRNAPSRHSARPANSAARCG